MNIYFATIGLTLLGAITSGQSGPGSNDIEGQHNFPHNFRTVASLSDGSVSSTGHSWKGGLHTLQT